MRQSGSCWSLADRWHLQGGFSILKPLRRAVQRNFRLSAWGMDWHRRRASVTLVSATLHVAEAFPRDPVG